MPESKAKGVYVDTALLLARCTRVWSTTAGSIADAFARAHRDRNFDLYNKLDTTSLEVPILEERKKAPTRHPKDLEDHVSSILDALNKAQDQVLTQARILFSSRRFADQDLVILLATAGQYYRLAVAQRDHKAFRHIPNEYEIQELLNAQERDTSDLGEDTADFYSELVISSTIKAERQQIEETRKDEKEKQQLAANKARDAARMAREAALNSLKHRIRQRSKLVLKARMPPYTDGIIEEFYRLSDVSKTAFRRYPKFFEPEPLPTETIDSFAQVKSPKDDRQVVFSSTIRVGSPVSDKFVGMMRGYLEGLARIELARRN